MQHKKFYSHISKIKNLEVISNIHFNYHYEIMTNMHDF